MTYESSVPTPWAITCMGDVHPEGIACNEGELIHFTEEFYERQMAHPDYRRKCPRCRGNADWSDENYETHLDNEES